MRGSWQVALGISVVAGCSSSSGTAGPAAAPATVISCPATSQAPPVWPAAVPAGFPTPPTAVLTTQEVHSGVTYVHFTTSTSLREGVVYLVTKLRSAGYVLGRGDAERNEADAPFAGPTVVGALRLTRIRPCQTAWILAVAPRVSHLDSGTFIPHHPAAGASPLPFGTG